MLRQQVSVTVAPGGIGKSSNGIVEALAMVTGRPLTREWVQGPMRVWLYNLETRPTNCNAASRQP